MRLVPARLIPGLLLIAAAVLYGAEPFAVDLSGSETNGVMRSLTFAGAADMAVAASADLRNAYAGQKLRERAWVLECGPICPV